MHILKLAKSKNSVRLHIPTELKNKMSLSPGDYVVCGLGNTGCITVRPLENHLDILTKIKGNRRAARNN